MNQYQDFSHYYDELTQDQPYDKWLSVIKESTNSRESILDIGCGTGSLTSLLTDFSSVTGMDLSEDMLAIASNKSKDVTWLQGDMSDFDLGKKYDTITILCDSLNYLQNIEDVKSTFSHVYQHLNYNGTFIFDVHSIFKMNHAFANHSYIDETEHVFLGWDAVAGEEPNSVWHYMTFFELQGNGQYKRYDEEHYQRTYSENEYKTLLNDAGFEDIHSFYDFEFENHHDQSDRLFFIAKK